MAFMSEEKELQSKVGSHGLKLSTEGEGMHMTSSLNSLIGGYLGNYYRGY